MDGRTLYLAHFTFRSGEVEIPFHQTVRAADLLEAEQVIRRHLQTFAIEPEPLGYLSYAYDAGSFAIDCDGIDEALQEYVIRHLELRA